MLLHKPLHFSDVLSAWSFFFINTIYAAIKNDYASFHSINIGVNYGYLVAVTINTNY